MRYHHGHRTDHVERKGIMRFLDFEDDAFKFNGQPLQPGHYTIPFEFKLPTDIPASMQFKDANHKDKPCMKIKFHIRVNLLCNNEHDNMVYKQIMVIRTAVPPFKEGEKNLQQIQPQDNSFCSCFSSGKGKTTVGTLFEKNIYTPNEVAIAHVDINNEECKTDIHSVSFYLMQKVWACTIEDGRTYNFNFKQKLCKHKIRGPKAGDNIMDE